jgi:hypothetical protein
MNKKFMHSLSFSLLPTELLGSRAAAATGCRRHWLLSLAAGCRNKENTYNLRNIIRKIC